MIDTKIKGGPGLGIRRHNLKVMFRIGGYINLDNSDVVQGQKFRITVGPKKNKVSFIQYLKPLSVQHPYFFVHILNLEPESCVTIGIANEDISDEAVPGNWTNTIGYESTSGKCLSSHRNNANTVGKPVQKGDSFGLLVTHFGAGQSTVVFVHNGEPIATRYHFESNHSQFLPTITLENGPIEIEIMWHNSAPANLVPDYETNFAWIKPNDDLCAATDKSCFENLQRQEDLPIQSPVALSRSRPHYKCIQMDVSPEGNGSSVGIASCSPLKPTPTCSLLRDYYTWLPKMKLKNGNSIGWGVFYNPDSVDKNDKSEQLILVFVTFNESIIDVLFVLQPEGGFFPLVLMQPWSTRVQLEIYSTLGNEDVNKLTKFYHAKLAPAIEIYNKDMTESTIDPNDIRISDSEIEKIIDKTKTIIRIPKTKSGVHYIQFRKPITPERRFFFVELIKLGSGTNVVLGIASSRFIDQSYGKQPGQIMDTIGYHSKTGYMYYNGKYHGNMMGHKCSRGDSMALEMEVFEPDMSVAIFSKNYKPVGTRFLTLKDFNEFLPTFAVQNNGEEFEMNVYWHTVVSMPPHFNVRNPEDWCYPEGTKIDPRDKAFVLPHHYDHSVCLQAPYSLHHKYNHFEIVLSDDFDKNNPPPAIALCTACPFDPPPVSQFKQDYLRFWPTGEAMTAVKKNDRLGWGIFYADEDAPKDEEQLMICFLTINRQVVYLRVLFQPPGGFYPVVIAPPNVYKVKMDFGATRVSTEDFAGDQIKSIILDANKQIEMEKKMISQGKNPREQNDDTKRSKMCTII